MAPRISSSSGAFCTTRRTSGARKGGNVAAIDGLVERAQEPCSHSGVDRRPVVGEALARVAGQGEDQALAGGAEPASRPVEAVEHDTLHGCIEAAAREGRSLGAGVCDRGRAVGESLHDLACNQKDAGNDQCRNNGDTRNAAAVHRSSRPRNATATSKAAAPSAAEKRNEARKLRVIVVSIVEITSLRTAARRLSVRAP